MFESFQLHLDGVVNGAPLKLVRQLDADALADVAYEQGAAALALIAAVLPVAVLRRSGREPDADLSVHARTRLDLLGDHGRDYGTCVVVCELLAGHGLCTATVQRAEFALEIGERAQVALSRLDVHSERDGLVGHVVAAVNGSRGVSYLADAIVRLWGV